MFARFTELVRCDHWPPPTGATSLASGLEACMGALPDQIALKLGKRAEDEGIAWKVRQTTLSENISRTV